jgi:apolipoprotein N-acyltransferase
MHVMARPRIRTARPTAILGGLLVVLAAAVVVGVLVHVCHESGSPADRHLPVLLALLLAAVGMLGLGLALILPRPPRGS